MLVGYIKTKDVLTHPWTVLSISGYRGFFKILSRALSWKKYPFLDCLKGSLSPVMVPERASQPQKAPQKS